VCTPSSVFSQSVTKTGGVAQCCVHVMANCSPLLLLFCTTTADVEGSPNPSRARSRSRSRSRRPTSARKHRARGGSGAEIGETEGLEVEGLPAKSASNSPNLGAFYFFFIFFVFFFRALASALIAL